MIDALFYPRSIAVIGASQDPKKVGFAVVNNCKRFDYAGAIYPINPSADEILGIRSFSSVTDVRKEIDLAVIAIPAPSVPRALTDCIKKGIPSAVIISAGFKETGAEGTRLEEEIRLLARNGGMRLLGPNCLGVINTANNLNATFAAGMLPAGRLAFFSQSGALGIAILDWAIGKKVGFSKFISLGNKADLNETDFIEYFINDTDTDIILGYIEDVVDGDRFMNIARKATKIKPIILVKSGGTQAGARAASSHTGALAGSESAFHAAFRQTGVIRAAGIEDLFETAMAFSSGRLPADNNLLIITNAGGPGIIAADTAERLGINLAPLSKQTTDKLRAVLPKHASLFNPVDIIGDATADRYKSALECVLKDPAVNGILIILTPQNTIDIEDAAHVVIDMSSKTEMPIITSFMGEERVRSSVEMLTSESIPNFSYPEPATAAFRKLSDYALWTKKEPDPSPKISVNKTAADEVVQNAIQGNHLQFTENLSRDLLSLYGFQFPAKHLAESAAAAASAAADLGFPVVMKIDSPDILHKTDVGGVKLNIMSKKEARDAFSVITMNARKFMPTAFLKGVSVYKMAPMGQEVILGITFDRTFGHLIMFGLGGIYVEVFKDVSFRIVPLGVSDAFDMIQEIRSYPILKGVRGQKPADVNAIAENLIRLSVLSSDFPVIQELDINPLVVYERGSIALDARIIINNGH